jgi:hypothetical protein
VRVLHGSVLAPGPGAPLTPSQPRTQLRTIVGSDKRDHPHGISYVDPRWGMMAVLQLAWLGRH